MIDLFLGLLDRLVDLLKYRGDLDRRFFEDHIEVAYRSAREIADDYRAIFIDLKRMLRDATVTPLNILGELENRRTANERLRIEFRAGATALRALKSRHTRVNDFAESCLDIIRYEVVMTSWQKSSSRAGGLLGDLGQLLKMIIDENSSKSLRRLDNSLDFVLGYPEIVEDPRFEGWELCTLLNKQLGSQLSFLFSQQEIVDRFTERASGLVEYCEHDLLAAWENLSEIYYKLRTDCLS